MGFSTRGCIRNCKFCIVRDKEGLFKEHAPITEFLKHDKLILMDNNFLASNKWKEKLNYLINNKIKVNFNSGIDVRLLDDEKAQLLSKTKCYDWHFFKRGLHIAWDNADQEQMILDGIKILLKYFKPHQIMCYILIGFNTTIEQDLHRIITLKRLGIIPYVQLYNSTRDPKLRKLARWVNRKYYQFVDWEKFGNENK
jgi:hypothetical protein